MHKDTGLLAISYLKNARRKYPTRDRVFIPKEKLKVIEKAASTNGYENKE
ncbi:MAG: hypothetical protein IBX64_06870 [Actinobacteria bacterium]|nr:hypothetical protein [Actinomycetota bacterium]